MGWRDFSSTSNARRAKRRGDQGFKKRRPDLYNAHAPYTALMPLSSHKSGSDEKRRESSSGDIVLRISYLRCPDIERTNQGAVGRGSRCVVVLFSARAW